ncbi:hypothetical protein Avbf_09419 [Armadillidium vulgare]|nr:hypothetical protein Avbf_09420 [Armadillidium vulgare]RXG71756.1 hypothetical protein Avbf_09419 [Armadillidium vulgare]
MDPHLFQIYIFYCSVSFGCSWGAALNLCSPSYYFKK